MRPWLERLDRLLPRPGEVVPAVLGAAAALVPLVVVRVGVAATMDDDASPRDLWRVLFGEFEFWSIAAFVAVILLRLTPGRAKGGLRITWHFFCTVVMLLSIVELAFLAVTGSRVDFDLLFFAARDAPQVFPVFASEVRWYDLLGVVVGLLVGMWPAWVRPPVAGSPWWGRACFLLLVPAVVLEADGSRPRPGKTLREAQPSLVEQLWWDGLERLGDTEVPPTPGDTEGLLMERAPGARSPNIVLIFLESVGASATTLHAPELPTTPNLVDLAARGVMVENATAVVPHTSKALITTLCGNWPKLVSDIREAQPGGLPGRCLPDLLGELGYRTAFFQTADELFESRGELVHNMRFGLFRGRDAHKRRGFEKVNYFGIEDRAMIAPGVAWSRAEPGPFFATYLTLTSHHDYGVPTTFQNVDLPGVEGRQEEYYNAVRYVDAFVGDLVRAYEEAGLADDTLFVLLGDHGEAFGEHGPSQHDMVIWEEGLRVPMVLYGPGVLPLAPGARIAGPRQQIDVVPTILELLGVGLRRGSLPGTSLLAEVPADRTLFHSCWRSHRCVASRTGDRKFIDHYRDGAPQVFDLAADPGETRDLRPDDAEIEARSAEVRGWRSRVNGRYEALHAMSLERLQRPDPTPAIATWGGKIDLIGCRPESEVAWPASDLWIACRWRAREELRMAWRISTRVEGGFDTVKARARPLDGVLPTFQWRTGWAVDDSFKVDIPADAEPGEAVVYVGWERYGGDTIDLDAGGEQIEVARVRIEAPDLGDRRMKVLTAP